MGVSADQVGQQKEFDDANDLGFPLLSDPDRKIQKQFGVKRRGPLPSKRATFVVGSDRKVLDVNASELSMNAHADGALAVLKKA